MPCKKQDTKAVNVLLNSKVFDMLDKVAETTELSKATIVETYVARGLESWFKEFEPNSPVYKKWLEFNKKQKL